MTEREKQQHVDTMIAYLGDWSVGDIERAITTIYKKIYNEQEPSFPKFSKSEEIFYINDRHFRIESKSLSDCYLFFYRWLLRETFNRNIKW